MQIIYHNPISNSYIELYVPVKTTSYQFLQNYSLNGLTEWHKKVIIEVIEKIGEMLEQDVEFAGHIRDNLKTPSEFDLFLIATMKNSKHVNHILDYIFINKSFASSVAVVSGKSNNFSNLIAIGYNKLMIENFNHTLETIAHDKFSGNYFLLSSPKETGLLQKDD